MTDLHVPQWTVTDRLIKARESEHLTQHDMAERFGVNTKTIGRWGHDDGVGRRFVACR